MIVPMAKVRILGPRALLDDTLRAVQNFGLVQIAETPPLPGLTPLSLDLRDRRRRKHLLRIVEDTQVCLDAFPAKYAELSPAPGETAV